jgi:hypothetical protein
VDILVPHLIFFADITTNYWTRNISAIRVGDSESNLTTEMAAVVKETDFIYGECTSSSTMRDFIICAVHLI